MQFKGKLRNQTRENGKNPNFGPNGGKTFFVDFTSTTC